MKYSLSARASRSTQKRHEYVTVVYDCDRTRVIDVLDDRKQASLEEFYFATPLEHLSSLKSVSMDMWGNYIDATLLHVPDAENKIGFDRFHVAKHIGNAVNKVRIDEHAELRGTGDKSLTGARYLWLQNPENMSPHNRRRSSHQGQLHRADVLQLPDQQRPGRGGGRS